MQDHPTAAPDASNSPGAVLHIDSCYDRAATTPKPCGPPDRRTATANPGIKSSQKCGCRKRLRVMQSILLVVAAAMTILVTGGVAQAQGEPTVDEIAAMFAGTTIDNWTDAGFVMTPDCVTAAASGAPAELGAMGFHAVYPARFDFDVVAAEPEALLVDGDGRVVGFEYEVPDQSQTRPTLFGVDFDDTPPHPGFDAPHWSLHVWTIDNPLGKFSPWNPDLTCPAAAADQAASESTLAVTGSETPLIGIIGFTLVIAGLLATSAQRRLSSQR